MIEFACPSCNHRFRVADELAGRKAKCKHCGNSFQIPLAEAAEEFAAVGSDAAARGATPVESPAQSQAALPSTSTRLTSDPSVDDAHAVLAGTTAHCAYEITQRPDFALVTVQLPPASKIFAEPSAMVAMTPSVSLQAGFKGGLGKSLSRALGGESMIVSTYSTQDAPGEVSF
ncbi:MAG: AIM24 family protein, partial [Planctomycetales bacterium]|nr:AIM24 family protein [Planctomycetales bacterium]